MSVRPLLAATAALAIMACGSAGPYELSLRVPKGTRLKWVTETRQTIRQVLPGGTLTTSQKARTEYSISVREVDSEGMVMDTVYDGLSLRIQAEGSQMVFDSRNPLQSTPALRGMQALVGEGFSVRVDGRGRITGVQGVDDLARKVLSASPGGSDPAAEEMLRSLLSPEAAAASLSGLFRFLPDRKVMPGDSWRIERPAGPGLPLVMRDTWRLEEVRGKRVFLALSSALMGDGLSGSQEGRAEVELSTGLLVSAVVRQKITGTILVRGLSVPLDISGESTIRQTKL